MNTYTLYVCSCRELWEFPPTGTTCEACGSLLKPVEVVEK